MEGLIWNSKIASLGLPAKSDVRKVTHKLISHFGTQTSSELFGLITE